MSDPLATRAPARRLIALLLCLLAVGLVSLPAGTAGADEYYPARYDLEIRGRGFGHGRGMSQYGAYRAASIGQTAASITGRYYTGSTLGSIGNPLLRVGIQSAEGDQGTVFTTATGLRVRDEQLPYPNQPEAAIDSTAIPAAISLWRVYADAAAGGLRVQYRDGGGAWHSIAIPEGSGKTVFPGPIRLFNNTTGTVGIQDWSGGSTRTYRGSMQVRRATSTTISLVNFVYLESYLRSVVPSEMPASWPAEALKAQAIAARSYAGWHRQHPRASTYDICDTQACQVYSGTSTERASTDSATSATAGQARVGSDGTSVVRTEFSSSNGGWVAAGGPGHAPAGYDAWSDGSWDPNHSWKVTATRTALGSIVGAGYTLDSLKVLTRDGRGDWGGRVLTASLTAHAGSTSKTVTVTGEDIRRALGLRSTLFTITTNNSLQWQTASGLGTNTTWSTHSYGPKSARPLVGDWDGDGTATPAVITPESGQWRWREGAANQMANPKFDFRYGSSSCTPIAGDWDGNGTDTPGLACASGSSLRWLLSNKNAAGPAAVDFVFGESSATPIVGDWNGAGPDRVGTVRPSGSILSWHLRAANTAGAPNWGFSYGNSSDRPLVGDWDGNGTDTPGVARASGERWTWYVRNGLSSGPYNTPFFAGLVDQTPLVGQGKGKAAHPVLTW